MMIVYYTIAISIAQFPETNEEEEEGKKSILRQHFLYPQLRGSCMGRGKTKTEKSGRTFL